MDPTSEAPAAGQTRIRQLEVVADLGQRALETDDLDEVLHDATDAVAETLATDNCAVFEIRPARDEAVLRQGVGWRDGSVGTATVPTDPHSLPGASLRTGDPIVVDDLAADARFPGSEPLTDRDVSSALVVRIGSDDAPRGVLGTFAAESRKFTEHEAAFVRRVAAVLSSAIDRAEREREWQRKERRYEAIFEDPNILVGLLEPDGTVLDINGTAMEYVDAAPKDVAGEPFWETPWWDGGDDVRGDVREWVERAATGEYVDFEADLTRPDGQRYSVSGYFRPVTNDAGDVVSIIVSDRDVTKQLERERALEESERRYRTLVEHFPNGAVTLVDETLHYRTVGGSPLDVAGVTVDEIEGQPVAEVVPETLADELVPRYRAAFDGESSRFELELGGRIFQFQVVPVRDEDGEIFSALGMSQDVTEREEAKRKLAESERRHRTLVENFPGGAVGMFDENLEYTAVGGQLMSETGVAPEDRIGNSVYEIYPDEIVAEVEGYFQGALGGQANSFEIDYHNRHLHAHTLPVRNGDGEVYAGMLVVQDVTERREYERKLEASNERLEQFAYAASHDLQEPLRMISSYLQLIEGRYGGELDADGEEFLDFAVDGADRMRDMIEGLLQYSRVDTRASSFEPIDLDAVLADARQDLQVKIEESDAEVTAEELPRVYGDGGQLTQVLQNLLANAVEYSGDEPPRVHVSAERREAHPASERTATAAENDGGEWVISVEDEGIGIDPADADRVFEVFHRLHAQKDHRGTGIGLALCERIVERHGGEIWVDSQPGAGATFSFTLPAAEV